MNELDKKQITTDEHVYMARVPPGWGILRIHRARQSDLISSYSGKTDARRQSAANTQTQRYYADTANPKPTAVLTCLSLQSQFDTRWSETKRRHERGSPSASTNQVVEVGELGHGGALSSGDDQRADALQLLRLPYFHSLHSEPAKRWRTTRDRFLSWLRSYVKQTTTRARARGE